MKAPPCYEGFGSQGAVERPARTINELPTPEDRLAACAAATATLAAELELVAVRSIPFGAPVYLAFGMSRPEAAKHSQAALLLTLGCNVSLTYAGYRSAN